MEEDREHWDAICKKCGKCCYEKLDLGGGLIQYLDEPCVYLDTETNLCKIYRTRQEIEPDCISLTETIVRNIHWLPEDCAYVSYVRRKDILNATKTKEKTSKKIKSKRRKNGSKDAQRQ
jgi:uncharacterized cysteine cluster protein YcgN (CxxCxxCC family)